MLPPPISEALEWSRIDDTAIGARPTIALVIGKTRKLLQRFSASNVRALNGIERSTLDQRKAQESHTAS